MKRQNSEHPVTAVPATSVEVFDESRILKELQRIADNPSLVGQYFQVLRSKYTSRRQVEVIDHWTEQFLAGARLVKAKTEMVRGATEYRSLEREELEKQAKAEADKAKHEADKEEHLTRATKARVERQIEEATLRGRIEAINNPPRPEPPPRQPLIDEQVAAQEAKIKRYGQESVERQKTAGSPQETQKWKVFYEDLINDAQEELKKLLRRR